MPSYLMEFSFTDKGMQNIKQSPERVEAAKEVARRMGGEVKAFYAILGGGFDTMFIVDAPNEEKAGEIALAIAAGGNVRTRTHRLFTQEEFTSMVSALR